MVIGPTRKPVSPPKATPARIVIATTGLNSGSMKNAARPATFKAYQNGNQHQLARLRLSALENEEEGQHAFEQNEQRNEVIFSPCEVVHADKQRQRNQKQDEQRGEVTVRFWSFRFSSGVCTR